MNALKLELRSLGFFLGLVSILCWNTSGIEAAAEAIAQALAKQQELDAVSYDPGTGSR